ncbi:MAG: cytidylate kinase family protein [Clostridia bacterium]|nr:cytidylate kinase family protein [Clostridia bacterium]MBR5279142.1 cytidylate kinase family protein [Clostridia bacterium]
MQIAFSGRLGSGKSTVCAILRDVYGYEIYSTGTVQRKVAEEMGITTLELNQRMKADPELDHVIDDAVVKISRERKNDPIVYDSRMAWHFAENTFKVYMYVDPVVAAERVFAADRGDVEKYESVEDAKQQLMARTMEENTRFKDIYGVDNLDYANYDMIIDSTSATPEQIANAIAVNAKRFEEKPFGYTLLLLSDKNVIDESDGLGNALISVKDDKYYLVSGKIEKEADVFVKAKYIAK